MLRLGKWLSLMVLSLGLGAGSGFARCDELVVLNWADYIDPAVVSEFEQEFGAKVRFIYFESDEGRDNFLMERGIAGIDVLLVDNTAVKPCR